MTDDIRSTYDVVVVGGGPAGYAAALWLARYRRRTLLIEDGTHRNRSVEQTHGYLGMDGATPSEVLARARKDLAAYPEVETARGSVAALRQVDGLFEVDLGDRVVTCLRLVLATGAADTPPDIAGFDVHYGASVFTCPSCDGYESRGCDVVTIGWNDGLADFSLHLLEWAKSVTIITDGHRFDGDDEAWQSLAEANIVVVEDGAESFIGERGALTGVRLRSGEVVPTDVAFFSIAVTARAELAVMLGCETNDDGYIVVDDDCLTSVPGVYAAGDMTPGPHLVQVAAAEGAVAGFSCARSLKRKRNEDGSTSLH
ncbi:MAG TPA: NAD(P)/FAD-dependent oxidoreductase [Mycobacteriales bacterium]|nr:NAD(P)/FAD-dependent oxidoreductase [Mycobacteriales bacterium]